MKKSTLTISSAVILHVMFMMALVTFAPVELYAQSPRPSAGGGTVTGGTTAGGGSSLGNVGTGGGGTVNPNRTFTLENPLRNIDSVGALVQKFVEIFSYLAIIFAVLVLIYIGFLFVLAQGDPKKLTDLKRWLGWTVVGIAVIIGARLMVDVVINTLESTGTVNPNVINSARDANRGR